MALLGKYLCTRFSRRKPPLIARRIALAATWLLAGLVTLHAMTGEARAQTVSREYQLKAAFLFNFAQFTEWPTNAFVSTNEPLVIGVLGTNHFGNTLAEIVSGETVQGRPIKVEFYRGVEEVSACHILFISQSEERRLERILNALSGKPILTVSDIPGSAMRGVMIRLAAESNRIRIHVNLEAVRAARLSVSSKLLRVAEIVSPRSQP